MSEDKLAMIKAGILRDTAAKFRRKASEGMDVEMHLTLACLLERRAERIAAGEDDFTAITLPELDADSE